MLFKELCIYIQTARRDITGLVTIAVAVEQQNVADPVSMNELKVLASGVGSENIICVSDFEQLLANFLNVSRLICNSGM